MSARTTDAMLLMLMFHCPALLLQILLLGEVERNKYAHKIKINDFKGYIPSSF